ncbi:uncharacterized protein LOC115629059 [Scaptodrosophila lebanonensis]|uniref:Uncharacterized protein LOC115629059 n=1 Tax=Drosophila lebanonensis TaxID=7225 RepID=A0A6J2TZZ8_DROLE|nr:uncharacterized protein LOC115629059 [Scaptodrosophila lebanonensis]
MLLLLLVVLLLSFESIDSKNAQQIVIDYMEEFKRLDRNITKRLRRIVKKYIDIPPELEKDVEFVRMLNNVIKSIDLGANELDQKIDVLTDFEIYDSLRLELDRGLDVITKLLKGQKMRKQRARTIS